MGKLPTYLIIAIVVITLFLISGLLWLQNRGNAVADDGAAPAADTSSFVAFDVNVGGRTVRVNPLQSEQVQNAPLVAALPEQGQPDADAGQQDQPQTDQPAEGEQTQDQPQEQTDPYPAPTTEAPQPTAPPQPTAVPTIDPNAGQQPVGSGVNTGVQPIIFVDYVVQAGDTLYRITENRNTSIELMANHNIAADHLIVGETLTLPVANPDYCPGRRAYVVREKDTVFRIAAAYGTDIETIRALNNLNAEYAINVAQVLCVP